MHKWELYCFFINYAEPIYWDTWLRGLGKSVLACCVVVKYYICNPKCTIIDSFMNNCNHFRTQIYILHYRHSIEPLFCNELRAVGVVGNELVF